MKEDRGCSCFPLDYSGFSSLRTMVIKIVRPKKSQQPGENEKSTMGCRFAPNCHSIPRNMVFSRKKCGLASFPCLTEILDGAEILIQILKSEP